MKHGSLFSGIGGFDLAADWMGWENVFHCEWNEFGKRVLKYYWPNAESFHDITKTDFKKYANEIDILSGGFPCQPYSMAGKRLGKEDERHLWPEMLRAIREIAPRYVVGENVRGLTNWNGGMVFDEVCSDLENLGYQVAPYLIPASAVNAPHKRERIWFVAHRNDSNTDYTRFQAERTEFETARFEQYGKLGENASDADRNGNGSKHEFRSGGDVFKERVNKGGNASNANRNGLEQRDGKHEIEPSKSGINALDDVNANDDGGNVTDAVRERLQRSLSARKHDGEQRIGPNAKINEHIYSHGPGVQFENFPTQSPLCGGNDGLSTELDGITFSKWRTESIKAYGNAVVPQVVYEIFKAIEKYESI